MPHSLTRTSASTSAAGPVRPVPPIPCADNAAACPREARPGHPALHSGASSKHHKHSSFSSRSIKPEGNPLSALRQAVSPRRRTRTTGAPCSMPMPSELLQPRLHGPSVRGLASC
eukprot:354736-Chlamydomonas_euryale.AAC.11